MSDAVIARWVAVAGRAPRRVETLLSRVPSGRWSLGLVGAYVVVVSVPLVRHAMWRDEAQMWLIGRASGSVGDLLANMAYENRPALWFLLVWPISRISGNPDAIKALTLAAAGGCALVISRWLPLKRIEQVALLGGFLFILGYSTVSTGYMVGTLATLLWFVSYSRGSLVGQLSFAALMAATHSLFLLVAAPLWILTFVSLVIATVRGRLSALLLPWVAVAASAAVIEWSAWLVVPPEDYGFAVTQPVPLAEGPLRMLEYAGSAVQGPGVALPWPLALLPLWAWALPVGLIAIVALVRGRLWLAAPVAGLIILLANGVFGYGPYWWHAGVVVVVVMLTVLMTRQGVEGSWFSGSLLSQSIAWWLVLLLQLAASFSAPGSDLWGAVPYSGGKSAAEAIAAACPHGCPIVTNEDSVSTSVSAYLGGTPLHNAGTGTEGTFTVWDADRLVRRLVTWNVVREALLERGPDAVAVLSRMSNPPDGFEVLAAPVEAVWPDESFVVVRLDQGRP